MKNLYAAGLGLLIVLFAIVESVPAETDRMGVSTGSETQRSKKADGPAKGFAGEKIIIGGTGDSQELLRLLALAFKKKSGGGEIEVPDSIGSSGGIKALLAGKIDMARVARRLTKEEEKLGLVYLPLAQNPVVFVLHPDIADIDNITTAQIIGIYSGQITSWNQLDSNLKPGRLYPVTRESGDSSRTVLNENLTGFKDIKVKEPVAKIVYSTPKTVEVLARYKATVGFLPMSAATGTNLRVLKLDGIYPTAENVRSGRYTLAGDNGLVYKGKLDGLGKRFVDFIHNETGRRIIIESGAIPAL